MAKSNKFTGTSGADILIGNKDKNELRGLAGDDFLTGGSKEDIFIFESSLAANGTDTILDFQVKPKKGDKAKDNDPDILDLRLAIGKDVKIKDSSIDKYVWVVGENLYVDPTGKGVATTPWAILKGVKDGDELRVRAGSFDGWITAKKSKGDTTPPVFNPNANYTYKYDENQRIDAVVATVLGASDDSGSVTQYRFSNGSATSADGYFVIDAQGKIKITEAGWGAAVNDYEAGTPNYDYYVQAGDAAGNWSVSQKITLSLNDLGSGSGSNIYLSLDRDGLWFDTDKDGKRDNGEALATYTASGSLKRVDGVDMEEDNVTLRLMDAKLKTPMILDLTGFGADSKDKIVFDAANYKDYFNWQAALPAPFSADKIVKITSGAVGISANFIRQTKGVAQYAGFGAQDGLRQIYGGYSYAVGNPTIIGAGKTVLARGIVAGYSTEFLLPEIPDFYISLGRNGAWIDTNQNGVLDGSESLASVTSAGGGYYTVDGVNMGTDKVFLRVVDAISATPLDLTGFGSGDKLIIDGKTTQADMYGMDQFFKEQAKSSTAISFSTGSSASVLFSVYSPVYRQAFIGFTSLTVPVYTANSKQLPSLPYGVYGYGYSSGRKQTSFYNPLATGLTRGGIQVEVIPPQPLS